MQKSVIVGETHIGWEDEAKYYTVATVSIDEQGNQKVSYSYIKNDGTYFLGQDLSEKTPQIPTKRIENLSKMFDTILLLDKGKDFSSFKKDNQDYIKHYGSSHDAATNKDIYKNRLVDIIKATAQVAKGELFKAKAVSQFQFDDKDLGIWDDKEYLKVSQDTQAAEVMCKKAIQNDPSNTVSISTQLSMAKKDLINSAFKQAQLIEQAQNEKAMEAQSGFQKR